MNHTPEQPLQPHEAEIISEPDPDQQREDFYYIEGRVKQVGLLTERLQLALNDYNLDNADIDVLAGLNEECLIVFQELGLGLTAINNQLAALTKSLAKQAF